MEKFNADDENTRFSELENASNPHGPIKIVEQLHAHGNKTR